MPVAFIVDFPDGTVEKYDAVTADMRLEGRLPAGGVFHVAGPGPAGGLRVIDVWESDAVFEAFIRDEVAPRTSAAGMSPPQIERVEVEVREPGPPRDAITFAHVTRLPLDATAFRGLYQEVMAPGPPEGMVFHANGPAPDGTRIVIGAWTSQDARDRMLAERVIPAAQRRGMGPPVIEDMAVHAILAAAAGQPARA